MNFCVRLGHENRKIVSTYEYIHASQNLSMRGGNALAGWSNTRAPVVTPRLKVIMVTFNDDESLVKKFNDWITAVMSLEIVDFIIDKKSGLPGRLRMLSECLAASLLMYLSDFLGDVTKHHCVVEHILKVSSEFNYSTNQLFIWGEIIKSDWNFRTAKAQATSGDLNDQVLAVVSQLRDHIQDLQNELISMKTSHKKERAEDVAKIVETEKIKEKDRAIYGKKMSTMLAMIVDLSKPPCIRSPPSISRKRRSNFVVDDSEILSPHPLLLEEFPELEETSTNTASQSTVSLGM